jgi:hypothetical protein
MERTAGFGGFLNLKLKTKNNKTKIVFIVCTNVTKLVYSTYIACRTQPPIHHFLWLLLKVQIQK